MKPRVPKEDYEAVSKKLRESLPGLKAKLNAAQKRYAAENSCKLGIAELGVMRDAFSEHRDRAMWSTAVALVLRELLSRANPDQVHDPLDPKVLEHHDNVFSAVVAVLVELHPLEQLSVLSSVADNVLDAVQKSLDMVAAELGAKIVTEGGRTTKIVTPTIAKDA